MVAILYRNPAFLGKEKKTSDLEGKKICSLSKGFFGGWGYILLRMFPCSPNQNLGTLGQSEMENGKKIG